MEFKINNECFYKAITEVNKAVSRKSPLPILECIKIVANSECLILVGSNADFFIEKVIPLFINGVKVLEVINTGCIVISAKYLGEIVKKLPQDIFVKVNEQQIVTIRSGEVSTNLKGFNSKEYPRLPHIDGTKHLEIPSIELNEMIKQTIFAVSKSGTRPVLTGVNMLFDKNRFTCVATNSHRLALRELAIESNINGSFIVPSANLNELSKLFNNGLGMIHIYLIESYIVFKSNNISLFSRLIEGNYPNVSGLFSAHYKTGIILDTIQFLQGIDRAYLFASEWRNNNVQLEIKDGNKIQISSNSLEIGEIVETQTIKKIVGETDLSISLDGNFLLDALKAVKEKEVKLSFSGPMRPVLIEPLENPSYIQLISPVRTY
ncbi:DNA polymerase III subunit beta [Viridibacillus sp. YIM B01967]|uniref:Beta sliding clamp n=1 Tax=Viridibacillus soli TaxID=2798301 RepID=A0ABS1H5N5_9BACL|nr:DNA polymerase III subunit beta [Viridibacillus soli]MBK3494725.1 DNA polymerase III subunit beta [Viridibacillus soli]